jgi:hypothetical protein
VPDQRGAAALETKSCQLVCSILVVKAR